MELFLWKQTYWKIRSCVKQKEGQVKSPISVPLFPWRVSWHTCSLDYRIVPCGYDLETKRYMIMGLIKFLFSLFLLLFALAAWPLVLIVFIVWGIFKGLMMVGMDKDFEPWRSYRRITNVLARVSWGFWCQAWQNRADVIWFGRKGNSKFLRNDCYHYCSAKV